MTDKTPMTPSPQQDYFLISKGEIDFLRNAAFSEREACSMLLRHVESRPSPAPTDVRTPDELLSIMREVIKDDLMIQSLHQIIHEKLKIHDVTIGEEAAIVAATRKELLDEIFNNPKITITKEPPCTVTEENPDGKCISDDEHCEECQEQHSPAMRVVIPNEIFESLRSTPSAPEQEERR